MKIQRVAVLLLCLFFGSPALACTIFCFTHNGKTYFCNNEDWKDPATMIRFHPASEGNYAWVYLGFTNDWAQGGVNEKGLCFDWVAGGGPYGWITDPDKKTREGNLSEEMLRTCANVQDAIAFYQTYNEKHFDGGRTFIADKEGNSALVGWENGKLLIQSGSGPLHSCGYGKKAVDASLEKLKDEFSLGQLGAALNDASQVGKYPSQYSNIIDLSEGKIVVFQNRNYDQFIEIDYSSKLQEGPAEYMIADLFASESRVAHVRLSAVSGEQQEHETRIQQVENGLFGGTRFHGDSYWTIEERLEHYNVPGLCLAVIKDNKVVWSKAYGVKDRETGESVTTNTLFQCASISKSVSAMAALRMAEAGVFDLDADVNRYLDSWTLPDNKFTKDNKVTLKQLLGHTGGVNVRSSDGYSASQKMPTLVELLDGVEPARSAAVRVEWSPGSTYRYSGGGYCVIQQMMIDAKRRPFAAIMDELLLEPLGMTHCTFQQPLPVERASEAAVGHLPDGNAVAGQRHSYPEMAAAGLYANARQLARFFIEIQLANLGRSDRVLSQSMTQQMLATTTRTSQYEYALGVIVRNRGGEVYLGHDGGTAGFCSEAIVHRDRGYGVVVLTNGNHPWLIREVFNSVARAYQWHNYAVPEFRKLPVTDEQIRQVAGRYRHGTNLIVISNEGGRLLLASNDNEPVDLYCVGENLFASRIHDNLICYSVDEKTDVEQISFQKPWEDRPHPSSIAKKEER